MDPCDFIGMQREDALRALLSEFLPAADTVDGYDWEPGDAGRLVVVRDSSLDPLVLNAVFAGWLGGGAAFRLVPDYGGDGTARFYMRTLAVPDLASRASGDWWLTAGFLDRMLPRTKGSFWAGKSLDVGGVRFDLSVGVDEPDGDYFVAHCMLRAPLESRLDEVLS